MGKEQDGVSKAALAESAKVPAGGLDNPPDTLEFERFHNALRILSSIDASEFFATVGYEDEAEWSAFLEDPRRWFIVASDGDAQKIFALIEKRQSKRLRDAAKEKDRVIETLRQSLREQAEARADPTMPLLAPASIQHLRDHADAAYGCSNVREDRVFAHALDLLCTWQERAAALKATSEPQS